MPIAGVQIYRSRWSYGFKPKLIEYLEQKEFLKPETDAEPTWHVVSHWNDQWRDGYGGFYYEFIREADRYIKWAEENPQLAEVVFSDVATVLREGEGGLEDAAMLLFSARFIYDDMTGPGKGVEVYRTVADEMAEKFGFSLQRDQ